MVQRGGKARTYHVPQINRYHIVNKIKDNIAIEADLVSTDESQMYKRMPDNVKKHEKVNHSAKEWVRGEVHTGRLLGTSIIKRGIIGSFHQVSIKHLGRYLNEFQFRWNNREAQSMFALVVTALVIGAALPYAELIGTYPTATPSSVSSDDPELWLEDEPS